MDYRFTRKGNNSEGTRFGQSPRTNERGRSLVGTRDGVSVANVVVGSFLCLSDERTEVKRDENQNDRLC